MNDYKEYGHLFENNQILKGKDFNELLLSIFQDLNELGDKVAKLEKKLSIYEQK